MSNSFHIQYANQQSSIPFVGVILQNPVIKSDVSISHATHDLKVLSNLLTETIFNDLQESKQFLLPQTVDGDNVFYSLPKIENITNKLSQKHLSNLQSYSTLLLPNSNNDNINNNIVSNSEIAQPKAIRPSQSELLLSSNLSFNNNFLSLNSQPLSMFAPASAFTVCNFYLNQINRQNYANSVIDQHCSISQIDKVQKTFIPQQLISLLTKNIENNNNAVNNVNCFFDSSLLKEIKQEEQQVFELAAKEKLENENQ